MWTGSNVMTDDSVTATFARPRPLLGPAGRFIVAAGKWMLNFDPEGSLAIHLPDGQVVRFGHSQGGDATLHLNNFSVVRKAIRRGSIGFAEAYIDGDLDSADLVGLFRFFIRNRERLKNSGRGLFKPRLPDRLRHLTRRNSRRGSRENITEHYDLGNNFFARWLSADRFYSSAYFDEGADTLEAAQAAKAKLVLDALAISPGDSMLEIGCGWGELSLRAVRDFGARVHGITLSREQLAGARERTAEEGLSDACTFALQDYRDVDNQFDRIVSIEMIEAVGEENWPLYFRTLHDSLKPGGVAAIQAITIAEPLFETYRRKADFIQRYIFPGGMLPTVSAMAREAERAGLRFTPGKEFGLSYAQTLREWRQRFEASWPEIAKLGFDARFRRKWRYYLAYCEAGFLEGMIDVGVYRLERPALNAS
jgi:cyclopropane-fatty-acyl-phospholipid synthase